MQKSKLHEILAMAVEELDNQALGDNELGLQRVMTLTEFIKEKYNGNQRACAKKNNIHASQLGEMLNTDKNGNNKFIVVDSKLYRLAKEEIL